MERTAAPLFQTVERTMALLQRPGLILASTKASGESNVMTIGWGTLGVIWGLPIFTVLVRPSRHTYQFIEESGVFTVNVPTPDMSRWVGICGTQSGRDIDKLGDYGVATSPALHIPSITIDNCTTVYECRVRHYNDVIPAQLNAQVQAKNYGGSDYHRLYYGEVLGTYQAE